LPGIEPEPVQTLVEALIASADPKLWGRYCRLAAELEGRPGAAPVPAPGSVEWQRRQERKPTEAEQALPEYAEQAGRRRLTRRGMSIPFAGAPSPFGAGGSEAFEGFLARRRGSPALVAQIDALEDQLVAGFEAALRSGRWRAVGFRDGGKSEVSTDWLGHVRLDFARNAVVLPDGAEIAGVEVSIVSTGTNTPPGAVGGRPHQRPAQAMLRQALVALWERGAFGAGTGNERVLALALRELGLSPADPPYGFKSAETVRKLRKALKMSL
jgi:hypothetical protein